MINPYDPAMNVEDWDRYINSLDRLSPDSKADLLRAYSWTLTHEDNRLRALLPAFVRSILIYVSDVISPSVALPALERFLLAAEDLLAVSARLKAFAGDDMQQFSNYMMNLSRALSRAIGFDARYRLYTIHFEEKCYYGLLSGGLPSGVRRRFDVLYTPFGQTLRIPFEASNYERIDNTYCHLIKPDPSSRTASLTGDGYKQEFGIGSDVPETYTWECSLDGLAEVPCTQQKGETTSNVAALSIDLGRAISIPFEERKVPLLLIKWLDILLYEELARNLALAITKTRKALAEPRMRAPTELATEMTLVAPFAAIRCDLPGRHLWIYSAGDESGEDLKREIAARQGESPWTCLLGPSGTGKTTDLTKALHNFSDRAGRTYRVVGADVFNNPIGRIKTTGAVKGAYTADGNTKTTSYFKQTHMGTLVLDEIYNLHEEAVNSLNTILTSLENKEPIEPLGPDAEKNDFVADVRLITTGVHSDKPRYFSEQNSRRLEKGIVWVPGWSEITRASRIVLLRWNMLRVLAKHRMESGWISDQLFHVLIDDDPALVLLAGAPKDPKRKGKNFGGLKDLWDNTLGPKCKSGEFTLSAALSALKNEEDPARYQELKVRATNESFSESLRIGVGSAFEGSLDNFEQLVINVAKASRGIHKFKATAAQVTAALASVSETDPGLISALDAQYLLLAATAQRSTRAVSEKQKDVVSGRSIKALYEYIDEKSYADWFEAQIAPHREAVLRTRADAMAGRKQSAPAPEEQLEKLNRKLMPGDFIFRGVAKLEHRGSAFFRKYVEELATDHLLRRMEKIACAYPMFLTRVPFNEPAKLISETESDDNSSEGAAEENSDGAIA